MYMKIPRPFKYLYYLWVKYVKRDSLWADLLCNWNEKSAYEQWKWVSKREAYKASWHEWWKGEELDFMLTPVNATPAVPHGGMKEAVSSCGYTFLFNFVRPPPPLLSLSLSIRRSRHDTQKSQSVTERERKQLDYTCGVMPITHVNDALDQLPATTLRFNELSNGVAKGAYAHYDADKMHGLPVAVQVVGQRLQEEKVLAVMERIEEALVATGGKYELLEIE